MNPLVGLRGAATVVWGLMFGIHAYEVYYYSKRLSYFHLLETLFLVFLVFLILAVYCEYFTVIDLLSVMLILWIGTSIIYYVFQQVEVYKVEDKKLLFTLQRVLASLLIILIRLDIVKIIENDQVHVDKMTYRYNGLPSKMPSIDDTVTRDSPELPGPMLRHVMRHKIIDKLLFGSRIKIRGREQAKIIHLPGGEGKKKFSPALQLADQKATLGSKKITKHAPLSGLDVNFSSSVLDVDSDIDHR